MKKASRQIEKFLVGAIATTVALWPSASWARTDSGLPWDQPLEALQAALIGPVAHSLIAMSFIGAIFAYAIVGDSEISRRLTKAGLGVGVALLLLRLMNYLLP
jgi:type IV secretory pathway VirB2 component (pilin)